LSNDGALAVICNECLPKWEADETILRVACRGYPAEDGRVSIAELPEGKFEHDMTKHPEMRQCRACGCTDIRACAGGCYWVEPDLCSACKVLQGNCR
jgi:hypothetical protein